MELRKIMVVLVSMLAAFLSTAQGNDKSFFVGNIISDTTTFSHKYKFMEVLTPILQSENKIEIRFVTISRKHVDYTILIYHEKWSADYMYYTQEHELISKDITSKADPDTIFSRLVSNNFFSLPDQDSLDTGQYTYYPGTNEFIGSGGSVVDGTVYMVEFKVGDFYRHYSYSNPREYAAIYPLVYEFESFANIADVFKEWVKE